METTETKENIASNVVILAEIQKSDSEIIRISRREYRGVHYIDTRVFFETKKDGQYRPTRKGIVVREDLFGELTEGILQAKEHLREAV